MLQYYQFDMKDLKAEIYDKLQAETLKLDKEA